MEVVILNMFRAYIFKLMRSPLLYLGFPAALALGIYGMYTNAAMTEDIFTALDGIISFDFYQKMFVLFSVLPFVSNFSDEWNSKVVTNCITRKNADSYAFANAAVCYLSAFAVIFAALMISVLFGMQFKPLYAGDSPEPPYGALLANGHALFALAIIVFVYASSCAMWAVMGLAATAFFPSRYIAVCAPFVFSYIIERLTNFFPGEFQLMPISHSWSGWRPLPAFLKSMLILLAISAVCCLIFITKVKRRVENELS